MKKTLAEILEKDGLCVCIQCGHLGKGSEFTVSNYPADDFSACCPRCDCSNEDMLRSVETISIPLQTMTEAA